MFLTVKYDSNKFCINTDKVICISPVQQNTGKVTVSSFGTLIKPKEYFLCIILEEGHGYCIASEEQEVVNKIQDMLITELEIGENA